DLSQPAAPAASGAAGGWDLPQLASARGATGASGASSAASKSPFDMPAAGGLPGDLDLLGGGQAAGAPSIDQLFGLAGDKPAAASQDPLADFLRKTEPATPGEAPVGAPASIDPLALLSGRQPEAQVPAAPVLPDHVPEL